MDSVLCGRETLFPSRCVPCLLVFELGVLGWEWLGEHGREESSQKVLGRAAK